MDDDLPRVTVRQLAARRADLPPAARTRPRRPTRQPPARPPVPGPQPGRGRRPARPRPPGRPRARALPADRRPHPEERRVYEIAARVVRRAVRRPADDRGRRRHRRLRDGRRRTGVRLVGPAGLALEPEPTARASSGSLSLGDRSTEEVLDAPVGTVRIAAPTRALDAGAAAARGARRPARRLGRSPRRSTAPRCWDELVGLVRRARRGRSASTPTARAPRTGWECARCPLHRRLHGAAMSGDRLAARDPGHVAELARRLGAVPAPLPRPSPAPPARERRAARAPTREPRPRPAALPPRPAATATTRRCVGRRLENHGQAERRCGRRDAAPARRSVPVTGARASATSSRSCGSAAPGRCGSASGRLDAVWEHDGILDVRDYKTGAPRDGSLGRGHPGSPAGLARRAARTPSSGCGFATSTSATTRRRPDRVRARRRGPRRASRPTCSDVIAAHPATRRPRRVPRRRRRRHLPNVLVPVDLSATTPPRPACPTVARLRRGPGPDHSPDASAPGADPRLPRSCRSTPAPPSSSASARPSSASPTPPRRSSRSTSSPTRPGPRSTDAGARRCSSRRHRRRRRDHLVAVPRSGRAARPAASASSPRTTITHHHRRQQPADAREPARARRSPPASTTSCCSAARSACTAGGAPAASSRRRGSTGPRPTTRRVPTSWGDDRPGSSQYEMAHRALAPTQVYPLFETALRARGGPRRRRAPACDRASCGRGFAAVAATNPARVVAAPRTRPTRSAPPSADNRMVVLPVHRSACAPTSTSTRPRRSLLCSYEAAATRGRPGRPHGVPARRRRRARPLLLHRARVARPSRPRSASPRRGRARRRRAHASTTSRASTSTRASRRRCSSRWSRSASAVRPAATTAPLTVTGGLGFAGGPGQQLRRPTRSPRWSRRAVGTPARSGS